MSNFKIAITTIFSICILVALVLFALSKGSSGTANANILVWGTIHSDAFDTAYRNSSLYANKNLKIQYVKKDIADFDSEFVEALADGIGPDIVVLRDDFMYKERNKLLVIPYKSYSERSFKDTFIEEGELFLSEEGVVAVPFIVDPLVLYWNRDMFSSALISQPPQYWDEFYSIISKITKKDSGGNILQSALALGEWRNINNAKEILSMILLQAGTSITTRGSDTQGVYSTLTSKFNYPIAPGQSAVNFYTQFSNPTSENYTWNRSLPSSLNFFLSGNLATYFGFASEIFSIQQKNSNLNFDVTYVPQIRDATKKTGFAHMYALALVKQSKNISSSFSVVAGLTEPAAIKSLESVTNLPPVRRDLIADRPSDAFRAVFYNSALVSHSWIDPNSSQSSNTFRDMIESITGGQSRTSEALSRAEAELNNELK